MLFNKSFLILLFIAILLSEGCISERDLLRKREINMTAFKNDSLNHGYSNNSDLNNYNLWTNLYECKTFKKDTTNQVSITSIILNLKQNQLTVTAMNYDKPINQILLKGKLKKDYLIIKRNLFLIPIPFLYFRHREKRVLISNDVNNNLILLSGSEDFLWILFAGGYNSVSFNRYSKIK